MLHVARFERSSRRERLAPMDSALGNATLQAVFGSSNNVVKSLRAALPEHSCIETFRNGVVTQWKNDAPPIRSGAVPTILWMGRLVADKDPGALISAAACPSHERLRLSCHYCWGLPSTFKNWYKAELSHLIQKYGLEDYIQLVGWIQNLAPLLESACIGVQTSHTEGLSLALLEQMSYGLAVVATDVGDSHDAIDHQKTGILIPPKDEKKLVQSLSFLLGSPSDIARIGAAAHRCINESFRIDVISNKAISVYSRILSCN